MSSIYDQCYQEDARYEKNHQERLAQLNKNSFEDSTDGSSKFKNIDSSTKFAQKVIGSLVVIAGIYASLVVANPVPLAIAVASLDTALLRAHSLQEAFNGRLNKLDNDKEPDPTSLKR